MSLHTKIFLMTVSTLKLKNSSHTECFKHFFFSVRNYLRALNVEHSPRLFDKCKCSWRPCCVENHKKPSPASPDCAGKSLNVRHKFAIFMCPINMENINSTACQDVCPAAEGGTKAKLSYALCQLCGEKKLGNARRKKQKERGRERELRPKVPLAANRAHSVYAPCYPKCKHMQNH